MNTKKMTTEHLEIIVGELREWGANPVEISPALLERMRACEKELARRWGINLPKPKRESKESVVKSLGITKVRGALGGTYYE